MTMFLDEQTPDDAELIGSRIGRIDPDNFRASVNDDDNDDNENTEDEPVDEDGDPTRMPDHGLHDHHQDDNYALGGHLTRSGS